MFEKILTPVDGSPDAWVALDQSIELAREHNSTIHVLFVADSKLIEAPYWLASMPGSMVVEANPALPQAGQVAVETGKLLAEHGQQVLADAQARCDAAGVPCKTEYVEGVVPNVILERARDADLMVIGRRGEGAEWAGPQLGSVLETVVRHAQTPVLVTQAEMRPIKRILVAFDGSDRAVDALEIAAGMASGKDRSIVLLTVDDGHAKRREAWELGKALLAKQGLTATYLFGVGHATEEILKAAKNEECDLIALGSHGHSHFMEIFFGSTVDEVLHRAISPVLICR